MISSHATNQSWPKACGHIISEPDPLQGGLIMALDLIEFSRRDIAEDVVWFRVLGHERRNDHLIGIDL